ncbi:pumilio homolog 3-like [Watersipora subatra]|uniref:pumilio homolog 3-like n=1 Tax=Watersipora subatra TaxID=2589382 RepID=UPI00355BBB89
MMAISKKRTREGAPEKASIATKKKKPDNKTTHNKRFNKVSKDKPLKRLKTDKPKAVILTSKEAHAKSKTLRNERRQKDRSHYDATIEMKKIWEDLRRQNLPKDQREQLCRKVMSLVQGKERDFAFAHDTTRIFQTISKHASQSIRTELFNSLKDSVLEMVKSTYSVFFVRSLLRRGTKDEKTFIIEKLMANARKLIGHKLAGPVVEFAYNEYANAEQRLCFAKQFYGPSFTLFAQGNQSLVQMFEAKPEKKPFILKHMKETLEGLIEKEALKFTFVHNLFYEYLKYSNDTDRQVMAESLQEHIAHIAHTREGARVAMFVVWYSSAKGRKLIVKQLKPYIEKLMVEEYGHMLLFAIFDAVDDTKLVAKLIVSEVKERLDDLVKDKWGRHIVLYLLTPRQPQHVNKEIRQLLALGDDNPFSKKDVELRRKELREEISPAAISYAADNLDTLLADNKLKVLLFVILTHAAGSKDHLVRSIAALYNQPYTEKSIGHPLNDKSLRFTIRKLLQSENTVVQIFTDAIKPSIWRSYMQSENGCHFISIMINGSKDEAKRSLIAEISKHKAIISEGSQSSELLALLT